MATTGEATAQATTWPYPLQWMLPNPSQGKSSSAAANTVGDPVAHLPVAAGRLTLQGLQGDPVTLSLTDLDLLPQKSLSRRWVNASGWSVRCEWQGVLLQHVIEKLRPPQGVTLYIKQTNSQGFSETIPYKEMLLHRPMLVKAVNGVPLPATYGGPLQMMLFHCFSYKGLPQLTHLSLTTTPCHDWSSHWGLPADGHMTPGPYYAWDLGMVQPIKRGVEVEDY
jgi:DMSO/TMAO reductase YedYZ molybdopterin-dependent catalytic subunit